MNVERFVKNVEELCKVRQISPTNACIESELNRSFLSDLAKGKSKNPRIESIEKLASFLGVTASDLLGENHIKHITGTVVEPESISSEAIKVAQAFDRASDQAKDIVRVTLKPFGLSLAQEKAT